MATLSELQDKWAQNSNNSVARALDALQDSATASDYVNNLDNAFDDVDYSSDSGAAAVRWALSVGSDAYPESISPGDEVTFEEDGEEVTITVPDWSESYREGVAEAMENDSWSRGVESAASRETNVSLDI